MKPGGRIGFVLPSTSIRQISGAGMRELIRRKYDLEFLILSGDRLAFSEGADFSEILLVAQKRKARARNNSSFVTATIKELPTLQNILALVAELKDAQSRGFREPDGTSFRKTPLVRVRVGQTEELQADDWLPLIPGE